MTGIRCMHFSVKLIMNCPAEAVAREDAHQHVCADTTAVVQASQGCMLLRHTQLCISSGQRVAISTIYEEACVERNTMHTVLDKERGGLGGGGVGVGVGVGLSACGRVRGRSCKGGGLLYARTRARGGARGASGCTMSRPVTGMNCKLCSPGLVAPQWLASGSSPHPNPQSVFQRVSA